MRDAEQYFSADKAIAFFTAASKRGTPVDLIAATEVEECNSSENVMANNSAQRNRILMLKFKLNPKSPQSRSPKNNRVF